jgi:2-amino-4-hydroxy-6-hydroxymethyldihydropteridine diphosphokinase
VRRAFLDVGTNLGDRAANLRTALGHLERDFGTLRQSSVFESAAVGPPGQPAFYNLAVELRTALSGELIRERLRSIEAEMGRQRSEDKYAPRIIDLDLIYLEGEPEAHPQLESEPFVLVPLCELVPGLQHPKLKIPLYQILAEVSIPPDLRRVGPVDQL